MEPPIQARCLKLCRRVEYNPLDDEAPYTLHGVINHLRPHDDLGYPLCSEIIWVYAEIYGPPGRYAVDVKLVPIDDDGNEVGTVRVLRAGIPVRIRAGYFVEGVRVRLWQVDFDTPGLYEFRLVVTGNDEPLVAERIYLMEI